MLFAAFLFVLSESLLMPKPPPGPRPISLEPLDFRGKEITVGATICYPVRGGKDMWLNELKVTQVNKTPAGCVLVGYDEKDTFKRNVRIKNLHTCVVVS